jgi:hypothetical protein
VRRARLERSICVGDGHSGVVVQVNLNVTADDATKGAHEVVDLARVRATDGVGDADAIDAYFVHGLINGEEVDEIGPEGVFGREADLDALGFDKVDDLDRGFGDISHILAVREFAEEGRGANDDVHAVHAGFDRDSGIVHVATDVRQDFGVETELADGRAVKSGLLGSGWGGQLEIFDAKLVEGLGDRDFSLRIKKGIGKLFALYCFFWPCVSG